MAESFSKKESCDPRLRGALFLAASRNGRNIMPALAQSEDQEMGLALLSSRHDEAELRRQQTTDYVRKDFAEVDESVRRETERKALGFRENWDSMGGKEKFFSIAIASFIAYRMLKSDNAFIKMTIGLRRRMAFPFFQGMPEANGRTFDHGTFFG